jgi:Outer membrane lipoprotein-sorting protein
MMISILSLAFSLSIALPAHAAAPTADEIVAQADEVRNPQLDYILDARVEAVKPDSEPEHGAFEVMVSGRDRTVIKTLEPRVSRGRTLLMRGRDMWVFLPDVAQPIRITLQQRLMGALSNGDLARANLSGDYIAKILRVEAGRWVLDLTAKFDDLTYHRIVYWVEKGSYRPYKAQFFALSDRLLKDCTYEDYRELGGRVRPNKIVVRDAISKGRLTTISYGDMRISPLAAKQFTKDYLKKLKY